MAETTRVGIIGAGWPGQAHARGYATAGGFKVVAVADLIPSRRQTLVQSARGTKEYPDADGLLKDPDVDAVSICLPNDRHASVTRAALRAGKHVICEVPPATSAKEAKAMAAAAEKAGKVLLFGFQRRFGPGEQAARQAVDKGYAGEAYHVRAGWTRTRGIPVGTGWYTDRSKSGGGALIDVGIHLLDLGWHLLGQPRPESVFGATHQRFAELAPGGATYDVEDSALALIRFEGGKTLELSASWATNQPPNQNGTTCRVHGTGAAIDVYTPHGATLYRGFDSKGQSKPTALKPPKVLHHAALMRHFRECVLGKATPTVGGAEAVTLMQIVEAIYASSEKGKSVAL